MLTAMVILFGAIVAEVFGSTMLKKSDGFKKKIPAALFVIGYGAAFIGLAVALETISLGVAYAIWAGMGTAVTVVVGILVFKEKINKSIVMGVVCVLTGVVLLNVGV